jgi:hypothetical protein
MLRNLFLLLLSINLLACASSQVKNNIKENNWQALGEYQGSRGLIEQTRNELQSLANKFGSGEVDFPSYQQGYTEALTVYCLPKNAMQLGTSNRHYYGVCERFSHGDKFRSDWEMAKD